MCHLTRRRYRIEKALVALLAYSVIRTKVLAESNEAHVGLCSFFIDTFCYFPRYCSKMKQATSSDCQHFDTAVGLSVLEPGGLDQQLPTQLPSSPLLPITNYTNDVQNYETWTIVIIVFFLKCIVTVYNAYKY